MGEVIKHPNYREPAKEETSPLVPLPYRTTCAYCGHDHVVPIPVRPPDDKGMLSIKLHSPPHGFNADFTFMYCHRCRSTWLQEALWAHERKRQPGFWRRMWDFLGHLVGGGD